MAPQNVPSEEQAKEDLESAVFTFFYYEGSIPLASIKKYNIVPKVVSSKRCITALKVIRDHSEFSKKPYHGSIVKLFTPGLEAFFFYIDAIRLNNDYARFDYNTGEGKKYSDRAKGVESIGGLMGILENLMAKLSVYLRFVQWVDDE